MNVKPYNTTNYEDKSDWTPGENKPNSNPIKANFRKAKMNVNSLITKDYRKKDDFVVRKNKPNSKPISEKPKMSANLYVIEDYENETAFGLRENKPNSNPISKAKNTMNVHQQPVSRLVLNKYRQSFTLIFLVLSGARLRMPLRVFILSVPSSPILTVYLPFSKTLGLYEVPLIRRV